MEFTPSQKSAQKIADKIAAAADQAGARVIQEPGRGVFFTKESWHEFIGLLLQDAFSPK